MKILILHLIAEFLFQSDGVRLLKRRYGILINSELRIDAIYAGRKQIFKWRMLLHGQLLGLIHTIIYTFIICYFMKIVDSRTILYVAIPHHIISTTNVVKMFIDNGNQMAFLRKVGDNWRLIFFENIFYLMHLLIIGII